MSHGGDGEIPEEHEEHVNHEAWVIPYADLLTLLMAMFIALFAISTVDAGKFKAFSRGLTAALGGGKLDAGIGGSGKATSPVVGSGNGEGPFNGGQLVPTDNLANGDLVSMLSRLASRQQQQKTERQTLQNLEQQIKNAANELGLGGQVETKQLDNGLEVTLLTDQVLFDSGQADIKPQGHALLDAVGRVLGSINNPILIRGFTDSEPISGGVYPDNNFLSAARAVAVMEYFLVNAKIDQRRMDASGRGELDPVASNATPEGRAQNRRVEIIVQSKLVTQTLEQAGLDGKAATGPQAAVPAPVSAGVSGATPNLDPGLGSN